MKKKAPKSHRRLPIDFGDEPLCPVPIRRSAGPVHVNPRGLSLSLSGAKRRWSRRPSPRRQAFRSVASLSPGNDVGLYFDPSGFKIYLSSLERRRGFTLVEVLVVLALLSLIVFALMAVFSSTQRAFRASMTQTDTLEGGRAVVDLIASDLEGMTPSYGVSNSGAAANGSLNFVATVKNQPFSSPPSPLYQSLVGSPSGIFRTNVLEDVFMLSKANINGVPSWIGTGYSVNTNLPDGTLYPLYRFYMATNAALGTLGQFMIYTNFATLQYTNSAIWSHMMDGVVNLTVRAYDTNGIWMTNGYNLALTTNLIHNTVFQPPLSGEVGLYMVSNAVPASVQFELGTMEDRTLEHAESLSGVNQSNFLANAVGQVHVFVRRVWIRNLDLSAYQ